MDFEAVKSSNVRSGSAFTKNLSTFLYWLRLFGSEATKCEQKHKSETITQTTREEARLSVCLSVCRCVCSPN